MKKPIFMDGFRLLSWGGGSKKGVMYDVTVVSSALGVGAGGVYSCSGIQGVLPPEFF